MRRLLLALLLVSMPAWALFPLLEDTAAQYVYVRLFDSADHLTPKTGVESPTITISKAGGSLGAIHDGTWAELAGGAYTVKLDDTDTSTAGPVLIRIVAAGCDDAFILCYVRTKTEAQIYTDMATSTALSTLQTDVGDAGAGLTAIGDTRLANLDAAVSTRSSHAAADIWSVEARTVTGGTVTAGTVSDKTGYSLSVTPPTASDIASAVWSAVTRTLTAFAFTPTPSNAADTTSIMAVTDKLDTMLEAKDGKYLYTSASVVKATSIDAAIVASIDNIEAIGNKLNDTLTDSGGGNYIFSEAALAEAPTGGGGDATAANQTTILADLAAIKGAAFSTTTDSLEAIRNRGDAAWTTSTVSEDKVAVNEDTGGTDNLRYMYNGQPISGATIRAYTKADYTAGTYTLRGKTTTNDEGRWTTPIYLDDGVAYTLVFNKHGEYGPTAVEVTP